MQSAGEVVSSIRRVLRRAGGFRPRLDLHCDTSRLGTEYGGWTLATKSLSREDVVYSFGVGEDISFDQQLIDKFGVTVHAFDPTPRSIDWVERQSLPARFVFHAYGLAAIDGDITFSPPDDPAHVSYTVLARPSTKSVAVALPVRRLATIAHELGHQVIDVLKMDIEGAEYQVINDILSSGIYPRQLLVEFHHFLPGVSARKTRQALGTLRAAGYRLFFVSQSGDEYSLLREQD